MPWDSDTDQFCRLNDGPPVKSGRKAHGTMVEGSIIFRPCPCRQMCPINTAAMTAAGAWGVEEERSAMYMTEIRCKSSNPRGSIVV